MSQAPAAPTDDGFRLLAEGDGWRVSDIICRSGPSDRPFEERHEHVTMAAVVDGFFRYRGEHGAVLMNPGAVLLGNAGACFECGHDHSTGDRCVALHLSTERFGEIARRVAGNAAYRFPASMLPAAPLTLRALARLREAGAGEEGESAALMAAEALIAASAGAPPARPRLTAREERKISAVLRFIAGNLTRPLSVGDLAGVAATSKYHFLRSFRAVTGQTPYQYILQARLRLAADRLARTRDPVAEVAFDAGFEDLSTFHARFRRGFGTTPRRYREQQTSLRRPGR